MPKSFFLVAGLLGMGGWLTLQAERGGPRPCPPGAGMCTLPTAESCAVPADNAAIPVVSAPEAALAIVPEPAPEVVAAREQADPRDIASRVYGRIEWVTSFPDYKVQVVTAFPDLRVQLVNSFPDSAGKWQIVTSNPDFRIQRVTAFPDFKIEMVKSFPGLP